MKHIKLFEQFVNEKAVAVDNKLAQATLDLMVQAGRNFSEEFYISAFDRDAIKKEYGKLPRGFAAPNRPMMSGSILSALAGDSVYIDGNELIKGSKSVMRLNKDTKWSEVQSALGI